MDMPMNAMPQKGMMDKAAEAQVSKDQVKDPSALVASVSEELKALLELSQSSSVVSEDDKAILAEIIAKFKELEASLNQEAGEEASQGQAGGVVTPEAGVAKAKPAL